MSSPRGDQGADYHIPHAAGCGHAGRAELLIDCEEYRTLRAVLVGMLW